MKPETLTKIRQMAEDELPIPYTMGVIDASISYGYREIFIKGAKAALSTPELLEGEGWSKVGWILNKPKNDTYRVFISAKWYDKQWNYETWEIKKIYDGDNFYWGLLNTEGFEFPYEDLSADMYFELPSLVPPPITIG